MYTVVLRHGATGHVTDYSVVKTQPLHAPGNQNVRHFIATPALLRASGAAPPVCLGYAWTRIQWGII